MTPIRTALLLAALLLGWAAAQASLSGEVTVAPELGVVSSGARLTAEPGLALRLHLQFDVAKAPPGPLRLRATLDPALRLRGAEAASASFELGLSEAYALWPTSALDLSAGLERLPLETARLSVPYRLEPLSEGGQPLGLLGVRASVYLDAWRLRPAVVYRAQDGQGGAVLSVRRDFGGFDLEAHASYLARRAALGLGGSGLAGEIVLYGETWLITNPWEARGALGASGYLGDALWSAELAYAPPATAPAAGPVPQLLAQFSLPQGEAGSWEALAGLALVESALEPGAKRLAALGSLSYAESSGEARLRLSLGVSHGELATAYRLGLSLSGFF